MSRDRGSQSSGQTLPLFAVIVPGLLALMALGLDGAQLFLERRGAQSAADLAALAGVLSLPDSPSSAAADAITVGTAHGFQQAQVVPVTPFNGDASLLEVTVSTSVDTFFMSILGFFAPGDFSAVDVNARAVAQAEWTGDDSGGGDYAILALEGCPSEEKSVDISGANDFFVGRVHSNSDVYFSGGNNTVDGETTHVCGFHNGDSSNDFEPDPAQTLPVTDPVDKVYDDYCNPAPPEVSNLFLAPSSGDWDLSSDGPWWVGGSKDSKTLRSGVYCARGNDGFIKLGDSEIVIEDVVSGNGGVTFVSKWMIDISGSDFDLHPHLFDVLFHAEGSEDPALKVAGSDGDWMGTMYAPNGTAEISGQQDINLAGGIVAKRVKLNGSNATINGGNGGAPQSPPQQTIALIE